MGHTAAKRIIESGGSLTAFDTFRPSAVKVEELGAILADNPAGVAQQSKVILLFLPVPREIEEVVAGDSGILTGVSEGSVIVDLSTTDPDSTRKLAVLATSQNVGYLDAPVLGRPSSIGNWALPVGGDMSYLDRCLPVLNLLASQVMPIGESGSGNKVKLLNQLMFGAINAMTAEMMAIARQIGIAPELLYKTITASEAGTVSGLFKELGRSVVVGDYSRPTFSVDLLCKDVGLATRLARKEGATPLLGETIERINKMAQDQGYGKMDTSVMWKCFESVWKAQPSTPSS